MAAAEQDVAALVSGDVLGVPRQSAVGLGEIGSVQQTCGLVVLCLPAEQVGPELLLPGAEVPGVGEPLPQARPERGERLVCQVDDLLALGAVRGTGEDDELAGGQLPCHVEEFGGEVGGAGGPAGEGVAVAGPGQLHEQPPGTVLLGLRQLREGLFRVSDEGARDSAEVVVGGVGEHRAGAALPQLGQGELDQRHPAGLVARVRDDPLRQPRLEPQPRHGVDGRGHRPFQVAGVQRRDEPHGVADEVGRAGRHQHVEGVGPRGGDDPQHGRAVLARQRGEQPEQTACGGRFGARVLLELVDEDDVPGARSPGENPAAQLGGHIAAGLQETCQLLGPGEPFDLTELRLQDSGQRAGEYGGRPYPGHGPQLGHAHALGP